MFNSIGSGISKLFSSGLIGPSIRPSNLFGLNTPINNPTSNVQNVQNPPNPSNVSQGTTPGLFSHINTTNPSTGATTTKPVPNQSVLAQQQMLNQKYGAGLVEDGLAGPKTQEAVSKYLSNPSNQNNQNTSITPAYNTMTGTLTDYGKSIGATPMQGGKPIPLVNQTTPTATFPGIISSLAHQENTPNNQAISQAEKGLFGTAATNPGTSGQAYQDYQNAVNELNTLKSTIAGQTGGIESQPISAQFQQGKEQALSRQNASLLDAAQQKVNQAQAALGYQIQGTQTQQAGFQQGGALGQAGQSLAQGALQNAGQLASPTGSFPFVFNPTTGTFSSGMGGSTGSSPNGGISFTGNPQTDAQNAAQAVISGKMTYQQAQQSLSYAGATGNSYLNSAITSSGGNPLTLEAQGAATQSNVQTAGTAGVRANQQVFQKAYSDYVDLQQSVQNVDQFGNLLTQNMGGVNPFDPKFANYTLAKFRNQLSSQQQAQFDTTVAALKSKISGLLSVGGNEIPTQITADAQKILDDTAPMGTLNATLSRIQAEGNILLSNAAQKVNTTYAGIQNTNTPTSAPTSGSSGSSWNDIFGQ